MYKHTYWNNVHTMYMYMYIYSMCTREGPPTEINVTKYIMRVHSCCEVPLFLKTV